MPMILAIKIPLRIGNANRKGVDAVFYDAIVTPFYGKVNGIFVAFLWHICGSSGANRKNTAPPKERGAVSSHCARYFLV